MRQISQAATRPRPRPHRIVTGIALAVAALAGCDRGAAAPAEPESRTPELLGVLIGDDAAVSGIARAAYRGDRLAVLATGDPWITVLDGARRSSFGKEGEGPAELSGPQDIAWVGDDRIAVRDYRLRKIVTYDSDGRLLTTRPLPQGMVSRLEIAGADTLVEFLDPFESTRTLTRLAGERLDTVRTFPYSQRQITLQAEGAPSLTLPAPYAASAEWTALPDGGVAYWDGERSEVVVEDEERDRRALPLPSARHEVAPEDRELWFSEAIPRDELRGRQDVFAPLRSVAREQVDFPAQLPRVMDLVADPAGGVWARRTTPATGELWTRLGENGPETSIRLPPGRRLLAIGESELAVVAEDDLGVQTLEAYARPR